MIHYIKHTLKNGLKVLIHSDVSTPMVAVNILYSVGSRNEEEKKTGFAHLFEHLMFSGSKNVHDFDEQLQLAGGENNAFTNSDITNYYDIVPANNIETVLWLESDRMKNMVFTQEALDIQKRVVVEEFKETSLNTPYGDAWHHLSDLTFKVHPYRWPTIGLVPTHVEEASLEEVNNFFRKYYKPSNAILVLAGNIEENKAIELCEKWFGDIDSEKTKPGFIEPEPPQTEFRKKLVKAEVPVKAIYMVFHMAGRLDSTYYGCDMLSDILGNGRSSRLYQRLHKQKKLFNQIDSYISGSIDPGMFVIEGKLNSDVDEGTALEAIWEELNDLKHNEVDKLELQKVKNKIENSLVFSEVNVLNKAMSLAYFEWLGDASLINDQTNCYMPWKPKDLQKLASEIFRKENCCVLTYEPLDVK